MATTTSNTVWYGRFLLFIAGMGGLLYGIDLGIIAAALLGSAKQPGYPITDRRQLCFRFLI